MNKAILCAIAWCGVSVGFGSWRVHAGRNRTAPYFEIVADPSLSHPQGCSSLLGIAKQELNTESVLPGSTLTVLVLGDELTANEPWQLGRYAVPATSKVLEGRSANLKGREAILHDIQDKCRTIRRTTVSPIFL